MIENVINFIELHLIPLGPPGLAAAAFVEELIAPLPSPMVMTLAGFFFLEGLTGVNFWATLVFGIAVVYALGMLAASLVWYYVAKWAGKPAIDRWGRYFGVHWDQVEQLKGQMRKTHLDEWTLFFFRVIPIVPSAGIAVLCGTIRFKLISYVWITFVGVVIRAGVFALLGWQAGEQYRQYAAWLAEWERVLLIVFLVILLLVVVTVLFRRGRR